MISRLLLNRFGSNGSELIFISLLYNQYFLNVSYTQVRKRLVTQGMILMIDFWTVRVFIQCGFSTEVIFLFFVCFVMA